MILRFRRERTAWRLGLVAAVRELALAVIVAITTFPFLTGTASATTTVGSCLGAGHTLAGGQQLVSPNGQYRTVMQGDGNLVLYTASGHALWHSRTGGNPGARTVLQGTDGNLVIYAPNNAVLWAAYTNTHPGDRLCMQSDANLVVYSSSNAALWATMTNHAAAWGQTLSYNPGAAGNCTYWAEYKFHWYTGTYYINTLATSGTTGDAAGTSLTPEISVPPSAYPDFNTSTSMPGLSLNHRVSSARRAARQRRKCPLNWDDGIAEVPVGQFRRAPARCDCRTIR